MQTIFEALQWRYATKKFDPNKKISDQDIHDLIEVLRLSPSSFGLQPWAFILVESSEIRKNIQAIAWNQAQVTEASHLLVLAVRHPFSKSHIDDHLAQIAHVRNVATDSLAGYKSAMVQFLDSRSSEEVYAWTKSQLYIALGFLMMAASLKHIDSCPMEGFDPIKCDKLLSLDSRGLRSVALCPIGYRDSEDSYATAKKVRFDSKDVFLQIF